MRRTSAIARCVQQPRHKGEGWGEERERERERGREREIVVVVLCAFFSLFSPFLLLSLSPLFLASFRRRVDGQRAAIYRRWKQRRSARDEIATASFSVLCRCHPSSPALSLPLASPSRPSSDVHALSFLPALLRRGDAARKGAQSSSGSKRCGDGPTATPPLPPSTRTPADTSRDRIWDKRRGEEEGRDREKEREKKRVKKRERARGKHQNEKQ